MSEIVQRAKCWLGFHVWTNVYTSKWGVRLLIPEHCPTNEIAMASHPEGVAYQECYYCATRKALGAGDE